MGVLRGHAEVLKSALDGLVDLEPEVTAAAAAIVRSIVAGGKVMAAGNGGSAAEAQHFTAELLGRLHPARERRPLSAVALHADSSTVTAIANDYGYDQVFSRQVQALGTTDDVLLVLSTSGASPNLVTAVEVANKLGVATIGLLGKIPRPLHELCRHKLAVPSDSLQAVQECHLVLVHVLIEAVEDQLAEADYLTVGLR